MFFFTVHCLTVWLHVRPPHTSYIIFILCLSMHKSTHPQYAKTHLNNTSGERLNKDIHMNISVQAGFFRFHLYNWCTSLRMHILAWCRVHDKVKTTKPQNTHITWLKIISFSVRSLYIMFKYCFHSQHTWTLFSLCVPV